MDFQGTYIKVDKTLRTDLFLKNIFFTNREPHSGKMQKSVEYSSMMQREPISLPVPRSPLQENVIPSLAHVTMTVSPICERSLQIRPNSPDGIFTVQL
jgi:hypothetical protein